MHSRVTAGCRLQLKRTPYTALRVVQSCRHMTAVTRSTGPARSRLSRWRSVLRSSGPRLCGCSSRERLQGRLEKRNATIEDLKARSDQSARAKKAEDYLPWPPRPPLRWWRRKERARSTCRGRACRPHGSLHRQSSRSAHSSKALRLGRN